MTDIKGKALEMANAFLGTDHATLALLSHQELYFALVHLVEQNEAFEQKLIDIASVYNKMAFTVTETEPHLSHYRVIIGFDKSADASMCHDRLVSLLDFLNPKPKPDPLVDVLLEIQISSDLQESQHDAIEIRKALDALGFEIREKNDDRR